MGTNKMQLTYLQEANAWEETLPIGNGSLGAMIWGGARAELLGLNQDTVWSGYPHDKNNPEAREWLPAARELLFAGKYREAQELIRKRMLGGFTESYLPLGNLRLDFGHTGEISGYTRTLDLERSAARVVYEIGSCRFEREYFASFPAKAIVMRLTCSRPALTLCISADSLLQTEVTASKDGLDILTQCPEHVNPHYIPVEMDAVVQGSRGQKIVSRLAILHCDGSVTPENGQLRIENASEIVLGFSTVDLPQYGDGDFARLQAAHEADYRALYDRVELYLGEQSDLPTDKRLEALRNGGEDNGLYALYFQYGRYLLISSSREGSQPANLQGIWNWILCAPWSSNWTTNINAEMNYWPAQSCNLKECLPPYFDLIKRLVEEGKKTARIHYGCRGAVLHHNTDYWGNTNPVGKIPGQPEGIEGSPTWACWPMGLGWMSSELYRNYEYNADQEFLRETVYPLLREVALFYVDWLVEHDGQYVTCPSTSPENQFETPEGISAVALSSAMDLAIIREVFGNFQKTCEQLAIADEILPEIAEKLARLAPFQVGSFGQILEWNEEFAEPEPGHRHVSPLYGLFPAELFAGDEALTEACRQTLLHRLENGGGHTGWSCAWIINLFAMLDDGEHAYEYLRTLLVRSTYDNLWDRHPPFQIDGNFGGTAAIANMLVQDRGGEVRFLPALPRQFASGFVRGLRIKNGKIVDIRWEDGKMISHSCHL